MKTILSYIKPFSKKMLGGFGIKVVGTVVELFLPVILSYILESVILSMKIERVVLWGLVMIACAALAAVCNIVANRMAAKVSRDIAENIRKQLFEKTLYLGARNTDRFGIASLESRITTDTYNVHSFLSMVQRMGVRAPILLIGGITITMIMDLHLSFVMIATLPLIAIVVYFISVKGVPLYAGVQRSVDKMVGIVREDVQGIRVIKALSKNEYENRRFDAANKKLAGDERTASIVTGISNPVMTLIMNLGITAVVAYSAVRVSENLSSSTTVVAFVQYFTLISMAMMALTRMFVMFTKCAASANRIEEVLLAEDDYFVLEKGEKVDTGEHIIFNNVSFSYFGKQNNIENVNFSLRRGGSLGIIGATGSGKSTLARLLMRFYDVSEGEILINGYNINTYSREELSSMFGVALQNDFLYSDTIEENIRFGRELSHEDIVRAAKIAQAHDFIMERDGQYSYQLAPKGTNISGGQKQRILIARAIAGRPEILILDDSSSALDYKTDAALRSALRTELSGSTVITVAQRVSSIKDSDLILVLDEGKVIGKGTHDELLRTCPEYREISESQMGGAFVE